MLIFTSKIIIPSSSGFFATWNNCLHSSPSANYQRISVFLGVVFFSEIVEQEIV
jgi:hypothetical protein